MSAAVLGLASLAGGVLMLISRHDEPPASEQGRKRYFYRVSGFSFVKEPAEFPWRSGRWQAGFGLLMYGATAALVLVIIWFFDASVR